MDIRNKLENIVPSDRVLIDEPMSLHTSFRIGGPADVFVIAENEEELAAVLRLVTEENVPHILIGNGSNFLVADEGYRGVMIKLGGEFERISQVGGNETDGDVVRIKAGGARLLSGVSSYATAEGLAGFEFASGIPGSVGGAMFMNAGAYGREMKDIVESVRLMRADGSEVFTRDNAGMRFAYRNSALQSDTEVEESLLGCVVLSTVFRLEKDSSDAIAARVAELQQKRNAKQPVNYPSAGSTFKRPAGGYAAALIDEAGLRGLTVGGAQVSEKHTGFVINKGGASCEDVLELMRQVRRTVYDRSGILLEPEVRLIGCEL